MRAAPVGRTVGRTTRRGAAAGTPRAPSAGGRSTSRGRLSRCRAQPSRRQSPRSAPTGRERPAARGQRRARARPTGRTARVAGCADAAGRPLPGRARTAWRAPTSRSGRAAPRPSSCASSTSGGTRDPLPLTELTHEIWHGFVPGVRAGAALRLPGARPLGPVDRRPLEPGEAAPRPVRARGGRRRSTPAARGVRACAGLARSSRSPTPCATTGTRRRTSPRASSSTTTTTWADDRRPEDAVGGLGHLRAARARLHQAAPGHPARSCAARTRGSRTRRRSSTCVRLGRDGRRAAAGPPVRARGPSAAARAAQLLGLQLDRLLRPARRRTRRPARRASRSASSSGWCARCTTAGIEVILDVVYNHTAEAGELGPMLSLRGIDNRGYYRLQQDARRYADYTGCGNTLHVVQPHVLRLITDSLRYWVTEMGVDGFRFDLAAALARSMHDVDMLSPFLAVIAQDPVLRRVKLIAEPWDVGSGGYQVGAFPPLWTEWNDRYRDAVRDFWRGALPDVRDLGYRLVGVERPVRVGRPAAVRLGQLRHRARRFHPARPGQSTSASTTRPTARATGTARTTTAPGTAAPRARPTTRASYGAAPAAAAQPPDHAAAVDRACRCWSRATRWAARSGGNNNAYCQDNEISWLDWALLEEPGWRALSDLTARLHRAAPPPSGAAPPGLLLRAGRTPRTGCATWPGSPRGGTEMTERRLVRARRDARHVPVRAGHPRPRRAGRADHRRQLPRGPARRGPPAARSCCRGRPGRERYELVVDTSREDAGGGAGGGAPGGVRCSRCRRRSVLLLRVGGVRRHRRRPCPAQPRIPRSYAVATAAARSLTPNLA